MSVNAKSVLEITNWFQRVTESVSKIDYSVFSLPVSVSFPPISIKPIARNQNPCLNFFNIFLSQRSNGISWINLIVVLCEMKKGGVHRKILLWLRKKFFSVGTGLELAQSPPIEAIELKILMEGPQDKEGSSHTALVCIPNVVWY